MKTNSHLHEHDYIDSGVIVATEREAHRVPFLKTAVDASIPNIRAASVVQQLGTLLREAGHGARYCYTTMGTIKQPTGLAFLYTNSYFSTAYVITCRVSGGLLSMDFPLQCTKALDFIREHLASIKRPGDTCWITRYVFVLFSFSFFPFFVFY